MAGKSSVSMTDMKFIVSGASNLGTTFKIGDRVNIDSSFEIVQYLQIGHGGWCEEMFEVVLLKFLNKKHLYLLFL